MTALTVVLLALLGVVVVIALWQLAVWFYEIHDKNQKYKAAAEQTARSGKPMLVIGGPWGGKQYRHWINKPAHGGGDVCMDIDPHAIQGHPCGIIASVTNIPAGDKLFGAAFASHLLEHLPNSDDAVAALTELHRVAEKVYICYPSKQSIGGWITKGHHLWINQQGDMTTVEERDGAKKTVTYTRK